MDRPRWRRTRAPEYIAGFDSASAMLRATAAYLHGKDFPLLGVMPRFMVAPARVYGALVNRLPRPAREQIYIWSGWNEAVSPRRMPYVDAERIARWAADSYPAQRQYPAVMLGSSNGALVHACCALGIPWLPQTALVPVRRGYVHPDETEEEIRRCREPARQLLAANPDVMLYHMHDPSQDRLMVQRMSYFRLKRTRLGPAYERFLENHLIPGGTIYLSECRLTWPSTTFQERHFFQFGALGGATAEEFYDGSERVREYLRRYGSHRRAWAPPRPDGRRPESEWGFEPSLREDVERFANERGFRVRRIAFDHPEDVSPTVADLYRAWNGERGVAGARLLVGSFILLYPYLAVRTGSVPYWMLFNKQPSADRLEAYLEARDPFDEVHATLFSHGVESIGLVPIDRWRSILEEAWKDGRLLGVDPQAYPRDFAVLARYRDAVASAVPARYPLSPPLSLDAFESVFSAHNGAGSAVRLEEANEAPAVSRERPAFGA